MTSLEKVRAELANYEHEIMEFRAELTREGGVELVIELKNHPTHVHTYRAAIHPRDLETPQFSWSFQSFLYDCLHDYVVELFRHTPQSRDE